MKGGALGYLIELFSLPVLRDKLLFYAQMRTRLSALRNVGQRNADRVFGALHVPDQLSAVPPAAGPRGRGLAAATAARPLGDVRPEVPGVRCA